MTGERLHEAELLLMQVTDSTFPIGAYAHSYGLETYVQEGVVHDDATASAYVARQIAGPLTYIELLGMRLAFDRALRGDAEGLAALDAEVAAYRAPAELRAASAKLGARFRRMVSEVLSPADPGEGEPSDRGPARRALAGYMARDGRQMLNVAYGAFGAAAGIGLERLLERYLYSQVSAMVTTCVKAIPLSQTSGQRIIRGSYGAQGDAVRRALAADEGDLGRATPGFDVRAIEHESLYSRLYMS